jgi:hypothetical protein
LSPGVQDQLRKHSKISSPNTKKEEREGKGRRKEGGEFQPRRTISSQFLDPHSHHIVKVFM